MTGISTTIASGQTPVKRSCVPCPGDRLVSLDYYCENTEVWRMTDRYYGLASIWCYLGNFGGNMMLRATSAKRPAVSSGLLCRGGDNTTL